MRIRPMYQLIQVIICYAGLYVGCVQPINVAVVLGQTVEIKCIPENDTSSVKWLYAPHEQPGLCYGNGFEVLLIVFESDPVCNITRSNQREREYDHFVMACRINYRGNWPPMMEWRQHGTTETDGEIVTRGVANHHYSNRPTSMITYFNRTIDSIHHNSNTSIISYFNITIDSIHHNSFFSCKTYFNLSSNSCSKVDLATNVPDYNHAWTSDVFYGPKLIQVNPHRDVLFPGDRLTCLAEANPEPDYKWTNLQSPDDSTIEGPVLVINETMVNDSYTFECEADNRIGQPIKKNVTFEVQKRNSGVVLYVAGSFGSVIFIVLFTTTIVILTRKFSRRGLLIKRNDRPTASQSCDTSSPNNVAIYEEIAEIVTSSASGNTLRMLSIYEEIPATTAPQPSQELVPSGTDEIFQVATKGYANIMPVTSMEIQSHEELAVRTEYIQVTPGDEAQQEDEILQVATTGYSHIMPVTSMEIKSHEELAVRMEYIQVTTEDEAQQEDEIAQSSLMNPYMELGQREIPTPSVYASLILHPTQPSMGDETVPIADKGGGGYVNVKSKSSKKKKIKTNYYNIN